MKDHFVFVNHGLVPQTSASLLVSDLGIQRGYAIFDFCKTIQNVPVFLDDHLDRFFLSSEKMRLPLGRTKEDLKMIVKELMHINDMPDSGIKFILTGGYSPDGYLPADPNLIITQQPLSWPPDGNYSRGIRIITFTHQRQMAEVKTTDYLMAVWLQPLLAQQGADDVLYEQQGYVTECPRSNFFIVNRDGVLVTPGKNILKGVIRKQVLRLAEGRFPVEERDLHLEEILHAREAFLTNTTKHLVPVVAVNDVRIGRGVPGPVCQELQEALHQLLPQPALL